MYLLSPDFGIMSFPCDLIKKEIIDTDGTTIVTSERPPSPLPVEDPRPLNGWFEDERAFIQEMDLDTLFPLISARIFDRYSMWELLMLKASGDRDNRPYGILFRDVVAILDELGVLIRSNFSFIQPQGKRRGRKPQNKPTPPNPEIDPNVYRLPEAISSALGVDPGLWIDVTTSELDPYSVEESSVEDEESMDFFESVNEIDPVIKVEEELRPPSPERPKRTRFKETGQFLHHRDEGRYFCDFPNCLRALQAFESKAEFQDHYNVNHITENDKTVLCGLCEQKFASFFLRNAHWQAEHEKTVACEICEKTFWKQRSLSIHRQKAHPQVTKWVKSETVEGPVPGAAVEEYQCAKCGKKISSRRWVDKHEAKCDGFFVRHPEWTKVNDEFYCTAEGCTLTFGFTCMYGLRQHFHSTHMTEEEMIFGCKYCDAKFAYNTTRNKHVKLAHLKKYVCEICSSRFGSKDKLQSHRLVHTGEKPFGCDKCEYRCAKKYNLDCHKQAKHSDFGEREFYCNVCGKPFCTPGRVQRHVAVMHQSGKEKKVRGLKRIQQNYRMNMHKAKLEPIESALEAARMDFINENTEMAAALAVSDHALPRFDILPE